MKYVKPIFMDSEENLGSINYLGEVIKWLTNRTVRPVAKTVLKYTTDGTTWKPIKTLSGNPDIYSWKVPAVSSTRCKVKVILKDASGVNIGTDVSNGVFTIQP